MPVRHARRTFPRRALPATVAAATLAALTLPALTVPAAGSVTTSAGAHPKRPAAASTAVPTRPAVAVSPGAVVATGAHELPALRTLTSRTYTLAGDVNKQTVVTAGPQNYRDAGGAWQPIDTTLTADTAAGFAWRDTAAGYTAEFPSSLADGPVKVSVGGQSLSYSFPGATSAAGTVSGSTVTYPSALPNVDVVLTATATGVKEDLRLTGLTTGVFPSSLTLSSGLTATSDASGVHVTDASSTTVFALPAAWAADAAGTLTGQGTVTTALGALTGGVLPLTVTVDPTWLAAPGRVFPVDVDPSVVVPLTGPADCNIKNGYGNFCAYSYQDLGQSAGQWHARELFDFDLTGVPAGATVVSADLAQTATYSSPSPLTSSLATELHALTRGYTSAVTYANYDGTHAWTTAGGDYSATVAATATLPAATVTGQVFHWYLHDLAQSWVNKPTSNLGMLIRPTDENVAEFARFASSSATSGQPTLTINWVDQLGHRPSDTFVSQKLTDRCTVGVNVGNGNLLNACADLHVAGLGPAVDVNRYYNSGQASGSGYADAPLGDSGGWRLSTGSYLRITGDNAIRYVDSTGNYEMLEPKTGGGYRVPAGMNADFTAPAGGSRTLANPCAGDAWQITLHTSQTKLCYQKANSNAGNTIWQLERTVDRNGNATVYGYTTRPVFPQGAISTITDSHGRVITFGYTNDPTTGEDFLTSVTDSTGRHVNYGYSGTSLNSFTDANNKTTSYGYGTFGSAYLLASATDGLGHETDFGYDTATGRATDVSRNPATGGPYTTHFTYNLTAATPNTDVRDARLNTTNYQIENSPVGVRITKTVDAQGDTRSTTWNSNDAVTRTVNPMAGQTNYSYGANAGDNGNESLTQITAAMGSTGKSSYTNTGATQYQASDSTDAAGNKTTYTYDGPGNLQSSKNAAAATATVMHNGDGTPATATDPAGGVTTYHYDANHRLASITPPSGSGLGTRTVTFDALDRQHTLTSGRGVTATYGYDGDDRLTDVTYSDSTPGLHYVYDAAGNLTSEVRGGSQTTGYGYDNLNRVTSKTLPDGTVLGYGYDQVGNLISLTQDGATTSYSYDTINNVVSMTDRHGQVTRFGYDPAGDRTDTWGNANTTSTPPSTFATHAHSSFDKSGRLIQIKTTRASSDADTSRVADYSYCYTAYSTTSPCPTSSGTGDRDKRQYTVDNLNGAITTMSYDTTGRLHVSHGVNAGHTYTYNYDTNGNVASSQFDSYNSHYYAYNPGNQACWELTTGTNPGTACTATPTGASTFNYDLSGNATHTPALSTITLNGGEQTTAVAPNGGSAAGYTYNTGDQTERAAAPDLTYRPGLVGLQSQARASAGTTAYFERDPSGGLVSEITYSSGTFTSQNFYVFDGQGSVVGLVTDSGTEAAKYRYDPYGNVVSADTVPAGGTLPDNPYRYTGQYLDTTGLYKIGMRYYAPADLRWTQQDSIETIGDPTDGNRYAYTGDDPINNTDPTGMFSLGDAFKVGAVVLGVAAIPFTGGASASLAFGAASVASGVTGGLLNGDSASSIAGGAVIDGFGLGIGGAVGSVGGLAAANAGRLVTGGFSSFDACSSFCGG